MQKGAANQVIQKIFTELTKQKGVGQTLFGELGELDARKRIQLLGKYLRNGTHETFITNWLDENRELLAEDHALFLVLLEQWRDEFAGMAYAQSPQETLLNVFRNSGFINELEQLEAGYFEVKNLPQGVQSDGQKPAWSDIESSFTFKQPEPTLIQSLTMWHWVLFGVILLLGGVVFYLLIN